MNSSMIATLTDWAQDYTEQREANIPRLQQELAEIEAKKSETERTIHAARLARERLAKYQSILGAGYACPRCWVNDEAFRRMTPRSGTNAYDVWACGHCHLRIHDEFRK